MLIPLTEGNKALVLLYGIDFKLFAERDGPPKIQIQCSKHNLTILGMSQYQFPRINTLCDALHEAGFELGNLRN